MSINIRFIANLLGKLILIESFCFLICVVISLCYGETDWSAFLCSAGISMFCGVVMSWQVKATDKVLSRKDGYFIVSSIWLIFSLFGALPYILSGSIPNYVDAFFETISGFTTTGATILNDIESLPHAMLIWRSMTQWLGGLGMVMLFIAILPSLGIEGRDLYMAETTGPIRKKMAATFGLTARRLWYIYLILTFVTVFLLWFAGMDWFDAINHAMTSVASGGFSTKQASIAYWHSPLIDYILIFVMICAATNFFLIYELFKGNVKQMSEDEEFRSYILIIVIVTLIITVGLYFSGWGGVEKSFRDALFQVVSIISSTGFATADYLMWPPLLGILLFILMFPCGSAGSTSGGIKTVRFVLLLKNAFIETKRLLHPNAVFTVKFNKRSVHPNIMSGVMGFFVLYMILFTVSSVVMGYFTEDTFTATSSVLTCLSNVGPGFGTIGPSDTFAHLPSMAKIWLALLMLIGRLEMYTVIVLFTRAFWKR